MSFKDLEGQLARWLERLRQFEFSVVHRKGFSHKNADGLSRRLCEMENCQYCAKVERKSFQGQEETVARISLDTGSLELWRKEQRLDPDISLILQAKELVVPRSQAARILEEAHDSSSGGHFGMNKTLMYLLGIKKTRTTPLHPQSDGQVERQHQTITNFLAKFVSENQKDWDRWIPMFLLAFRSSKHETTGLTPAELYFARDLRLPLDLLQGLLGIGRRLYMLIGTQDRHGIVSSNHRSRCNKGNNV
ncbi:uncharacterized protein [Temnothorax nylanderi]|uniref:uncharacterized protein n=1 Tax=Temnothorax nylanderi TaxID=102681 RepID=UPI003A89231F